MRKKKYLITLLTSGILILVGIAILSIGVVQGGSVGLTQQQYGPISAFRWTNSKTKPESTTYTANNEVRSIEIKASIGDIEIVQADTFKIEAVNFQKNRLSFSENDGEIKFESKDDFSFISLGSIDDFDSERKIRVSVPKTCNSLEVNADLGNVEMKDIEIKNLSLELNLGNLEATNIIADDAELSLDAGNAYFSGDFNTSLEIDNSLGAIEIELNGAQNDYDYDLETDLGDIKVGQDKHYSHHQNNGKNRLLSANADLGEITINFKK